MFSQKKKKMLKLGALDLNANGNTNVMMSKSAERRRMFYVSICYHHSFDPREVLWRIIVDFDPSILMAQSDAKDIKCLLFKHALLTHEGECMHCSPLPLTC